MRQGHRNARRAVTAVAACALIALGACSKEVGNNAEPKPGVGAKIDHALERTQEKLQNAGERTREGVEQAAEKTQEALSRAGDKITSATSGAVGDAKQALPGSPPYAPRQPVNDGTASAASAAAGTAGVTVAADPGAPSTTTTTLTTGPTTSVKVTGIPDDKRAALNDAAITASIKADLLMDPDLSALKIDVDTRDGVVTLNGLAGDAPAKLRAERMAQSIKGVREVKNYLTVKQG